jgi:hypothetical protein
MVLVKATLFAVLFGFAWINRYRLVPALLGSYVDISKRRLTLSIALQTGFGLAIVITAGLLSSLPPGVHARQSGKSQVIWITGQPRARLWAASRWGSTNSANWILLVGASNFIVLPTVALDSTAVSHFYSCRRIWE